MLIGMASAHISTIVRLVTVRKPYILCLFVAVLVSGAILTVSWGRTASRLDRVRRIR
jgi:hypothetical protein